VTPHHFTHKARLRQSGGAQNDTEGPGVQIARCCLRRPDTAADFDPKTAFRNQAADRLKIGGAAVARALQIDDMQVSGSRLPEGAGHSRGIVGVHGHLRIVALIKAYGLATYQINSWK
jgi:hypothetical protein